MKIYQLLALTSAVLCLASPPWARGQTADVQTVDTISALRALAIPTVANTPCNVSGYTTPGDGGGGLFVWTPIATPTASANYQAPAALTIVNSGAGYHVGDRLQLSTTNAYTATMVSVTSVNGSGAITSCTMYPGSSYSTLPTGAQTATVFYSPASSTPSTAATFSVTLGALDDGGSYINPNGNTGVGRWRRAALLANPEWIDVRWFGAENVSQGTTYDSLPFINNAIYAAPTDDYLPASEPGAGGSGHAKKVVLYFCGAPQNDGFEISKTLYGTQEMHFVGSKLTTSNIDLLAGSFTTATEQWMIQYCYGSASVGNPNTTFNTSVEDLALGVLGTNNIGASGLYYVGCNGGLISNVGAGGTLRAIYVDSGGVSLHNLVPSAIRGPALELHNQQITADYIDAEHTNGPVAGVAYPYNSYTTGTLAGYLIPAVLIQAADVHIQNITGEESPLTVLVNGSNVTIETITGNTTTGTIPNGSSPTGPVATAALARVLSSDNVDINHYWNQGNATFPNGLVHDYRNDGSNDWDDAPPCYIGLRGSYSEFDDIRNLDANALSVASSTTSPEINSNSLIVNQLVQPAPTVTNIGTPGSSSYGYATVAILYGGFAHSAVSASGTTSTGNATLSATNANVVSLPALNSNTQYLFYRVSAPAGVPTGYIGSVISNTNPGTVSLTDTGLAIIPGIPMSNYATNTTGSITVGAPGQGYSTQGTAEAQFVLADDTSPAYVTAWGPQHAVFGSAGPTGAGLAISHHASANIVYLTALAPNYAWQTLQVDTLATEFHYEGAATPALKIGYGVNVGGITDPGAGNLTVAGTSTVGANGTAVALHRVITGTLAAGVVHLSDTNITTTSRCLPTNEPSGYTGSIGAPYVSAQSAGAVTISSTNIAATNVVSVTIEN